MKLSFLQIITIKITSYATNDNQLLTNSTMVTVLGITIVTVLVIIKVTVLEVTMVIVLGSYNG